MSGDTIVVLGRLAEPYGIRGWLRLHPFGDDPQHWATMPTWWLGKENGPWQTVDLVGMRPQGDGWVVSLAGVADRTAAEGLKGFLVGAPRQALPVVEENTFYWADLVGLAVVNTAGEALGRVAGLMETGANDVLRVVDDEGVERLLPFVAAVVLAVEQEAGVIRVAWESDW